MSSTRQLLALACAASLFAACAAIVPNSQKLDSFTPIKECDVVMRGQWGSWLPVVSVKLKPGLNVVNVSDECSKKQMVLVGQRLTACGWIVPKFKLDKPWPAFTPIIVDAAGPDSLLEIQLFCKEVCSSIIRGKQSIMMISQKQVVNPPGTHVITISNDCKLQKPEMDLVGEVVKACSSDVAPTLTMDPWPEYSPVVVSGGDSLPTTVKVNQFCEPKP